MKIPVSLCCGLHEVCRNKKYALSKKHRVYAEFSTVYQLTFLQSSFIFTPFIVFHHLTSFNCRLHIANECRNKVNNAGVT